MNNTITIPTQFDTSNMYMNFYSVQNIPRGTIKNR